MEMTDGQQAEYFASLNDPPDEQEDDTPDYEYLLTDVIKPRIEYLQQSSDLRLYPTFSRQLAAVLLDVFSVLELICSDLINLEKPL